jgi:hypothetical protein
VPLSDQLRQRYPDEVSGVIVRPSSLHSGVRGIIIQGELKRSVMTDLRSDE